MTQWNPPSYLDFARQLESDPTAAGRSLDQTVQILARQTSAMARFVDSEVPRGLVDGSNRTFTLASMPVPPSSLHVYADGLRTTAYRLIGLTLTMTVAPSVSLLVDYRA